MNTSVKNYTIKPSDYLDAISNGKDFYLQFKVIDPDIDSLIIKIIYRYLEEYDIQYLKDTMINVIKELVNNAIKANMKRIYFGINDLDINEIQDYRLGMETFKQDTYQAKDNVVSTKLQESKLVVRLSFKNTEEHLHINVINNIPILAVELKKIEARMQKSDKYNDITEAFEDVLDDSEGAGLGLIMTMMLLKNCGLPKETMKLYRKNDLTIASISIPKNYANVDSKIEIADEIAKEIEEIPAIPENIKTIQKTINNPEATIKEISNHISLDPGLTASILKLANSAGYITQNKIDTIGEAVKIIGIKGINALLLATGVHKILDSRYKRFERIWAESYKRAFYAQRIAIQLRQTKLSDFAYLAGLLADIGYIILLSLKPDLIKKLQSVRGMKNIESSTLLEEIALGISHSSLGALISKKWNFNDALIQTIEFHHRPYMAPEKYKRLIYIVYLASACIEIEGHKMRYEILNDDVIEHFNLKKREDFILLHKVLKESYQPHSIF